LIIPEGTTVIEDNQFYNMQFTGKLVIPDSVTHIGENAFFLCGFSGELDIPDSVKSIGNHAFWGCDFTGELVIPENVEYIGDCAFAFCNNFADNLVILGEDVVIGEDAFYHTSCENIYIAGDKVQFPYNQKGDAERVFVNEEGKEITLHVPIKSTTQTYISDWNTDNTINKVSFSQWEGRYDVEKMSFQESFSPMKIGESKNLILTIVPEIAADQTIYWSSSNKEVATVENGLVKAIGTGVSTIAATTAGGDFATCEVVILPFKDVNSASWEYLGICYAFGYEMMTGMSATEFMPNGDLTRSQFVTALHNYSGEPKVAYENRFKDVPAGQWYSEAVIWAAGQGITAGYGDTFGVNDKITREQLVTMLYAHAKSNKVISGSVTGDLSGFADVDKVATWSKEAVIWATQNGLMSGKPKNGKLYIDPQGTATRAECATIMMQYDLKFGK